MATPYILYFISSLFALKGKQKKENKVYILYILICETSAPRPASWPRITEKTPRRGPSARPLYKYYHKHTINRNMSR